MVVAAVGASQELAAVGGAEAVGGVGLQEGHDARGEGHDWRGGIGRRLLLLLLVLGLVLHGWGIGRLVDDVLHLLLLLLLLLSLLLLLLLELLVTKSRKGALLLVFLLLHWLGGVLAAAGVDSRS